MFRLANGAAEEGVTSELRYAISSGVLGLPVGSRPDPLFYSKKASPAGLDAYCMLGNEMGFSKDEIGIPCYKQDGWFGRFLDPSGAGTQSGRA